jgi:very-short-patch-repair endonuclease
MSLNYNKGLINIAKQLRKNQTPQERKLWYEFLSKYAVQFQRQKVIDNFIVDFYCAKAKLVIELDGSWHYTASMIPYDENRTRVLEQRYGLKVLRFTNLDIVKNYEAVCTVIDKTIKSRISLPQPPSAPAPSSEGAN